MFLFKTVKPTSHEDRILQQLKKAGRLGVWNYELARPSVGGHRFSAYIRNLRLEGHGISCVRVTSSQWKYYYLEEKN